MSAIIAGAAIVGASAIGKGIYGASQNAKASEIERNNIRPTMAVQSEYQDNVTTAEQMARMGLPQQQYLNQQNAIQRNQAGALNTLGRSANPSAGLASIVRAGNDASNNLNAQDAAARNRNTLLLMQQRGILAGAKQNAWNYNYADKYSENLAQSQALRGAAAQNIGGAFNTLGQAGMMAVNAGAFDGGGSQGQVNSVATQGTPIAPQNFNNLNYLHQGANGIYNTPYYKGDY